MRQGARTALGQMVNVQAAADEQQADQVLVHGIHLPRLFPLPPAQINRTESERVWRAGAFFSDSAAVNVPRALDLDLDLALALDVGGRRFSCPLLRSQIYSVARRGSVHAPHHPSFFHLCSMREGWPISGGAHGRDDILEHLLRLIFPV